MHNLKNNNNKINRTPVMAFIKFFLIWNLYNFSLKVGMYINEKYILEVK